MSALHRVACPHCGKEVMLLHEAESRRWRCCHCEGIIDLDALDGVKPRQGDTAADAALPTAHAAPPSSPVPELGDAPEPVGVVAAPMHGVVPSDRPAPTGRAMRHDARVKVRRRLYLVHLLTAIFGMLALVMAFYPIRISEDSILPLLHPYFRGRPVVYPYFFGSPRWYLTILLAILAYGVYFGKPWSLALSVFTTLVVCMAFSFHPAAILLSLALIALVALLHRRIQVVEG